MASISSATKTVRPMMSIDPAEARRRVLGLYKSLCRSIPYLLDRYDVPKNECDVKEKIREHFYKHACVTDIRVVDLLVIRGTMIYKELNENWFQKGAVMAFWDPTLEPLPTDFIGKFLNNIN